MLLLESLQMEVTELKIGITPNVHGGTDCPAGETTYHFGMSRVEVDGSEKFGRVIVGKKDGGSFNHAQKTAVLMAEQYGWTLNRLVSDDFVQASENGAAKLHTPATFRIIPFGQRSERSI
jgi:hypothetical protein